MRKHIKRISLVMFILLVFGITTSDTLAVNVDKNTSQTTIVDALNKEQTLNFGNSYNVYRYNPWIFCRQKGGYLGNFESEYTIERKVIYPTDEQIKDEPNKYAIAFVFSYGKTNGYSKDDIQAAYWNLLGYSPAGDKNGKNQYAFSDEAGILYNKGLDYQTFKKQENNLFNNTGKKFNVTEEKNTVIQNNELIYGPIRIQCSCAGDFGGFDFEVEGTNVTTSNVQLCIKDGEEYKNIDVDNDRKIRTAEYSSEELYIKVNLNQVNASKINIKFKYNSIDATATLYYINGKHNETGEETIYCEQCVGKMGEATTDYSQPTDNQIVYYNNEYWQLESKSSSDLVYYNTSNTRNFPIYVFGNNNITSDVVRKW